jgi:hypothetical protein
MSEQDGGRSFYQHDRHNNEEPSITQAAQALLCHQYTKHTLFSSIPEGPVWKSGPHISIVMLTSPCPFCLQRQIRQQWRTWQCEASLRTKYFYYCYPSVTSLRTPSQYFLWLHLNHIFQRFNYSSGAKQFPMKWCKQRTWLYCGTSDLITRPLVYAWFHAHLLLRTYLPV